MRTLRPAARRNLVAAVREALASAHYLVTQWTPTRKGQWVDGSYDSQARLTDAQMPENSAEAWRDAEQTARRQVKFWAVLAQACADKAFYLETGEARRGVHE